MARHILFGLLALGASLASPAPANAQRLVQMRPIDRATVRVVAVRGFSPERVTGPSTAQPRVMAVPNLGHGSGVLVRGPRVITARHVVEGADFVFVMLPQSDDAVPAQVIFSGEDHDVAILDVPAGTPGAIALPRRPRPMSISQQVWALGYPIDVRQRSPAGAQGGVSRQTNDGRLQLSMSVNPGNSGGPVFDARDTLVGIAVARGSRSEGIAFVEPLPVLLEAEREVRARSRSPFSQRDDDLAEAVAWFVREHQGRSEAVEAGRAAQVSGLATGIRNAEEAALVAAINWNAYLWMLESEGARTHEHLPVAQRPAAATALDTAVRLSNRIEQIAPYMRVHYPVIRAIRNRVIVAPRNE